MKLSDKPSITPQVMAHLIGDETVVLDLATGTYFGLDSVGTRVWQMISEGMTIGEICEEMLEEFEVSLETLQRDVIQLADKLLEQKLISV